MKLRVRYLLFRLSRMIILNKIILKKLQKHSDAPPQTLNYFCFSIVFFSVFVNLFEEPDLPKPTEVYI